MKNEATVITCTECNEPFCFEPGLKVELPFVCDGCQKEAEDFNRATAPSATLIAAAERVGKPRTACGPSFTPDPLGAFEHGDPGDEHHEPHSHAELSPEDVATNELIADLEDQNATLQESLQQSDRVIEDLKSRLETEKTVAEALINAVVAGADRIQELEEAKKDIIEEMVKGTKTLGMANERLTEQREEIDDLEEDNKNLRADMEHAGEVADKATGVISDLKARLEKLLNDYIHAGEVAAKASKVITQLKTDNAELKEKVDAVFISRNVYREGYVRASNRAKLAEERAQFYVKAFHRAALESSFYENQGFWGRLFRVRYKTSGQF